MKTIIAGSRTINSLRIVETAIEQSALHISEVVCGGARGVDDMGRKWAANGNRVQIKMFPAKWDQFGKSAGYRRNAEMAEYADALIAVWDGKSRGTKHMIDVATRKGLQVFVFRTDVNPKIVPEEDTDDCAGMRM
jgi:glycerophosphoryl diester phosphodiesterase